MGAQRPAGWVPSLIPSINTMLSLAFENHDLVWTHGDRDGTAGNAIFFYWVGFFLYFLDGQDELIARFQLPSLKNKNKIKIR